MFPYIKIIKISEQNKKKKEKNRKISYSLKQKKVFSLVKGWYTTMENLQQRKLETTSSAYHSDCNQYIYHM